MTHKHKCMRDREWRRRLNEGKDVSCRCPCGAMHAGPGVWIQRGETGEDVFGHVLTWREP